VEHFNGENIMIFLLAGFSGINLFFNYINKRDDELVEIKYPEYSRAMSVKTRDQINRTC